MRIFFSRMKKIFKYSCLVIRLYHVRSAGKYSHTIKNLMHSKKKYRIHNHSSSNYENRELYKILG
jgi:hypothetical protein